MKSGYIHPVYKLSQVDPDSVPRRISYSQYSIHEQCPKRWELTYIKKLDPRLPNINTVFGTAMHETLQEYLTVMYTKSVKEADKLNLNQLLHQSMTTEYKAGIEKCDGQHFSTPSELKEYLLDGIEIIDWFKKRRSQYFSTKDTELVGIELDLCVPVTEDNPSVYMYGFLDIVIRDTKNNRFIIIDIKTSRQGWNKYQKADKLKADQLVLYKTYFSKQYGIDIDSIDIEFFIVKQKIQKDSMWPQKRIQAVKPPSGKPTRNKALKRLSSFVNDCFDKDGNKNEDREYMPIAGKGAKHCKYCPFKQDYENCPKENRIRQ